MEQTVCELKHNGYTFKPGDDIILEEYWLDRRRAPIISASRIRYIAKHPETLTTNSYMIYLNPLEGRKRILHMEHHYLWCTEWKSGKIYPYDVWKRMYLRRLCYKAKTQITRFKVYVEGVWNH